LSTQQEQQQQHTACDMGSSNIPGLFVVIVVSIPLPYLFTKPFFIRSSYFKFLSKKLTSFDKERKKEREKYFAGSSFLYTGGHKKRLNKRN